MQVRFLPPMTGKTPPHPNPLPRMRGRGSSAGFLVVLCLLLAACTAPPEPLRLGGGTMGTTWQVTALAPAARGPQLQAHIETRLDELVAQMSAWEPASDLSRFNRAAPGTWQPWPRDLYRVVEHAVALAAITHGAYDPTIAPLVDLWGFGAEGAPRTEPPDSEAIARARETIGWQRLHLDPAGRRALQPGGLRLDVNSLAPGYAVDTIASILHEQNVDSFLIELGGEMRAAGRKADGSPWRVAVEHPGLPVGADFDTIVALHDNAIGTSGDYRSGFVHEGRHFSHTLDPRTGAPVTHALSAVSVIAASAMEADAWAAALMVLGPDEGRALAESQQLAAVFTWRSEAGHVRHATPAFERHRAR